MHKNNGPKVRVRHDPGNQKLAEWDVHNATLPLRSWCEHCAGKMPGFPHKRRSSDRDVPDTTIDYIFMNRMTDRELLTVLNFLDCESGCSFACAVDKGPGDFPSAFSAKVEVFL